LHFRKVVGDIAGLRNSSLLPENISGNR
jgi:hypothetical protein